MANCLYNHTEKQGVMLREVYDDAVQAGLAHIKDGATDFASFAVKMRGEFGKKYDPYLDALWRETRDQYENNVKPTLGPGAPDIKYTAADYLPEYQMWQAFGPDEVHDSIVESAMRMAADNRVDIARDVAPYPVIDQKTGKRVKPWEETRAQADALGLTEADLKTIAKRGLPLDVVVSGIQQLSGEANLRLTKAAEYARNNPNDLEAKMMFIEQQKIADMHTLELIKVASGVGRALNKLKDVRSVLNVRSGPALAHEYMFGTQNPGKPLPLPGNAHDIAAAAPAPSKPQEFSSPTTATKAQEDAAIKVAKKKNPKPPAPVARGTQILDSPFKELAPPPLPKKMSVVEKARLDAQLAAEKPGVARPAILSNANIPRPVNRVSSVEKAVASVDNAGMARVRSVSQVISQTPHLADKLAAAHEALRRAQEVAKEGGYGGGTTNAIIAPIVNQHHLTAAKLYAETYFEAGMTSFNEFAAAVRTQMGLASSELPDEALRQGWRDGTGLPVSGSHPETPKNTPATTPQMDIGSENLKQTRAGAVQEMAARDAATPPPPRNNATMGKATTPIDGALDLDPGHLALPKKNAAGETDPSITPPHPANPQSRPARTEAMPLDVDRTIVDGLMERAKDMADHPLVTLAGGEAPEFSDRNSPAEQAGQLVMPDDSYGIQKTLDQLFDTANAEAVRKRATDTYEPPNIKRDEHIPAMLTELGGWLYSQKVNDFTEWCARMNGAIGRKIDPVDLVNAWNSIKPAALDRVRGVTDLRAAAIKRASELSNTEDTNKAIDEFSKIDPLAPDAAKKYSDVLKKYRTVDNIDYMKEVPGLQRALQTSFDVSAPFRQGLILTLSRPKQSIPAFWDMLKSFRDKDFGESVMNEVHNRPNSDMYTKFKLAMTKLGGDTIDLSQREEAFMTNLMGEIAEDKYSDPQTLKSNLITRFGAKGIEASERAYGVYLNRLRADVFDHITNQYKADGYVPEVYPELYHATARWINDATGRSELPNIAGIADMEKSAKLLSSVFFSARFQQSRLNVLTAPVRAVLPEGLGGVPAPLRKHMIADMAKATVGIFGMLAVAKMFGAQVSTDWRSSDFMKARFGNTRLDVMGGNQQWIRLAGQLVTGQKVTAKGHVQELDGKGTHGTRITQIMRFFQSKLAPLISTGLKIGTGQDFVGNTVYRGGVVPVLKDIGRDAIPLWIGDVVDGYQQQGAGGALLTLLQLVGMGVATYDDSPPQKRR